MDLEEGSRERNDVELGVLTLSLKCPPMVQDKSRFDKMLEEEVNVIPRKYCMFMDFNRMGKLLRYGTERRWEDDKNIAHLSTSCLETRYKI